MAKYLEKTGLERVVAWAKGELAKKQDAADAATREYVDGQIGSVAFILDVINGDDQISAAAAALDAINGEVI